MAGGLSPPSRPKHAYRGETAYAKDRTQTPHIPDAYQTLDKEDHLFFTLYSYARSGHWLIYQSLCVWICCVKAISTKLKHHPCEHWDGRLIASGPLHNLRSLYPT